MSVGLKGEEFSTHRPHGDDSEAWASEEVMFVHVPDGVYVPVLICFSLSIGRQTRGLGARKAIQSTQKFPHFF